MQDHIQDVHIMYGSNVLDTKSGTSAYKPHDAIYFDAEGNIVEPDATGTIPNTAVYMKTQEDISSLSSYPVWNKTLKETDINQLDIANSLDHLKDRNDVVTNSLKNKLQDDRAVLILSNLKTVIEHIDTLDISGLDILGVYNPERYEIYVLSEAIQDCLISDSFEDDNYTNIYLAIESGLLKKFKKTVGVDDD